MSWELPELPFLGETFFTIVGSYKEESRTQSFDADNTEQDMIVANITASTTDRIIDAHFRSSGEESTEWLLGFFFLDTDGELSVGLPGSGEQMNLNSGPGGYACSLNPQQSQGPGYTPLLPFYTCPDSRLPLIGGFGPIDIGLRGAFVGGSNEALGLAGYGQVTQKFFDDQLRISLGLRYSWDRKTNYRVGGRVGTHTSGGALPPVHDGCAIPGYESTVTAEWDSPTGDFKIEYLPTDENMVYGSIAYGWKPGVPGGLSISTDCLADPIPTPNAKAEGVWAYEAGSKNRFFDNRVQANLTGFYYVYANMQVLTQSNQTAFTDNAAESRIWGIEFEGIWMPIDDLTFTAVYGFLDAHYTNYQRGWNYATGEAEDFSGNNLIRAPRNQLTVAGEYMWSVGRFGYLIPRIQYLYSDEIYFSASNRPEDLEPSFSNLQARLRWQNEENDVFVEGFVENATNVAVRSTRSIGNPLFGRLVQGSFQPPRTWGIRIGGSY
jgi:outer membrane receptor protein involved in Fe transport